MEEVAAWLLIADRLDRDNWRGLGLCAEVEKLYESGNICGATESTMKDRIEDEFFKTENVGLYLFPAGEAEPRIQLARKFAEIAAQEAAMMGEGEG